MGRCTMTAEHVAGITWIDFGSIVLLIGCVMSLNLSLDVIRTLKEGQKSSYGSNAKAISVTEVAKMFGRHPNCGCSALFHKHSYAGQRDS